MSIDLRGRMVPSLTVAPILTTGKPRSRPKRGVCCRTPESVSRALRDGKTLKQLGLADESFPCSSRLAMLMTESGSDDFFEKPEKTRRRLDADDAEIDGAIRTIVRRWKLFRYDAKSGRHVRVYRSKKETSEQFKARVLRKIDAEFAIFWKIADITKNPRPAPHSHAEFMRETGRTKRTVSQCIASLVEKGYVLKFSREKTPSASLYLRPGWERDGDQFYHEKTVDSLTSRYVLGRRADREYDDREWPEEERPRPIRKRRVIESFARSEPQ
jgi:hypothetical protein